MAIYYGCDIPEDLYYHPEYDSWIRFEDSHTATMGMTDIAQTLAGRLIHIHFKEAGKKVKAGKVAATIESSKWVGPFRLPFDAEILAVNEEAFARDILTANKDPYGAGWLIKVHILQPETARESLLSGKDAVEYFQAKIKDGGIRCFRCVDEGNRGDFGQK